MSEQNLGGQTGGQAEQSQEPDVATMRRQLMQAATQQTSPLVNADPRKASPMEDVPMSVRIAVAGAKKPEDKIATLKQFYPDAVVRRSGGQQKPEAGLPGAYFPEREDILFTHPGTEDRPELKGRLMRYDPAWYDPAPFIAALSDIPLGVNPAEYGKPGDNNTVRKENMPPGIGPSIMGTVDTRSIGEQAKDAALETAGTAFNAATMGAGGKATQTGAGLLARGVERRAATDLAGKEAAAGAMGRPEVLDAAVRQGVPTEGIAPLVTKSPELQSKWWQMARNPKQANILRKELDRVDTKIEDAFTRSVEATGGRAVSKGEVGAGVRGGLEDLETHVMRGGATAEPEGQGVFRGLRNQGAIETAAVNAAKADQGMVPVPMLRKKLAEMEELARGGAKGADGTPMAADKSMYPGEFSDLAARIDANGGQLPMDYLRQKRTWMGENGGAHTLMPSNRPDLDQLYGQTTDDLGTFFKAKGGKAYDLWEEGQSNYRNWAMRRDALKDIARSPQMESAAEAATRGGTDAKTGLKRLDVLTESLDPQATADLKRMKLSDIGMTGQGETAAFDGRKYLKGWANTSDEMKEWLTKDAPGLRQSLDDVYTLLKAKAEFMGTRDPGTAAALQTQKSLKGKAIDLLMSPLTGVKDAVGGNLYLTAESQAQLMTNPKFVKWLAEGGKLNLGDGNGIALNVGRLGGLAASEGLERPVQAYIRALREETGGEETAPTNSKETAGRTGESKERKQR